MIPEDFEPLNTILEISATDINSGTNADILFSLDFADADNFAIDELTGDVSLTSKLDYECQLSTLVQKGQCTCISTLVGMEP